MCPRPIDMKMTIPKTQQLSRLKQNENNINRNMLQNKVVQENNRVAKRLKKVNDSEKTSHKKINKDDQNKNGKNHSGGKDNKKKKSTYEEEGKIKKEDSSSFLGKNIDIKI